MPKPLKPTFATCAKRPLGRGNKLHWVLDVPMREDPSRARAGHAAENLATLRRLALNLWHREKTKRRGREGKQLDASWNHAGLLHLLGTHRLDASALTQLSAHLDRFAART